MFRVKTDLLWSVIEVGSNLSSANYKLRNLGQVTLSILI